MLIVNLLRLLEDNVCETSARKKYDRNLKCESNWNEIEKKRKGKKKVEQDDRLITIAIVDAEEIGGKSVGNGGFVELVAVKSFCAASFQWFIRQNWPYVAAYLLR